MTPYRSSARDELTKSIPTQFEYVAKRRDANNHSLSLVYAYVGIPLMAAMGAGTFLDPWAGLVAFVGCVAAAYFYRKSKETAARTLLEIHDAKLFVHRSGNAKAPHVIRLKHLLNVALDTKTIQRIHEGSSAVPAVRFIDTRVGLEVDHARILLVTKSGEEIALSEERVAHMDATESFAKIRTFLRNNGWVPADERKKKVLAPELDAAADVDTTDDASETE
jgi:hypothetical protein